MVAEPRSNRDVKTTGSKMNGREILVRVGSLDGATTFGISFDGSISEPIDTSLSSDIF